MKSCTGCGLVKVLADYYKHPGTQDGHATKCKECAKKIVRDARIKNKEHYILFDKARAMRPDRVAARAAYRETDLGKAAALRARKAYASKSPERRSAHIAVGNALRDGKMSRQPCWVCGLKAHAHHPDYSRPLDVVWLCAPHHRQTHALVKSKVPF